MMPGDAGTTEETATAQGPAPSVEMGETPLPRLCLLPSCPLSGPPIGGAR